ncbi:MAG: TetR family transcriptional regulator [Bacillota bacterium]|nr:TetR family transcriptional regulator [Bacillota bacterium]
MPPKTRFSREEIINAAFEIAIKEGFNKITARSVAERLNSSVAPIYVNFKTIDDLNAAVVEKVLTIPEKLIAEQNGASLFEKVGKASIVFARKYPVLFRELVMKPNPYMPAYETVQEAMVEALGEDEDMRDLSLEERRKLFLKMQIFQTGLSVMIANGNMPSWLDQKSAEDLLMETGEELLNIIKINRKENEQ